MKPLSSQVFRPVSMVALAIALVIVGAGCGAHDSSAGADAKASGSQVEPGAYPVTIHDEFGSTTITSKPKRVVVVGYNEQDALLALGTVPIAVTDWIGTAPGRIFPWAKRYLGDAPPPVVLPEEIDFEKIAALKPDLIVALYAGLKEQDYKLLSAIAPTITHPKGENDYSISWQEETQTIGNALGRPQAAKDLIAAVDAKFAAARKKYPEFKGKQGLTLMPYQGIFVFAPKDPRGQFLAQLGFTFPPGLADVGKSSFGKAISPENADLIDVDALVWIGSESQVEQAVPTFDELDAAKQGRAVFIPTKDSDPTYVATSFVTVLSLPYLLNRLAPRLAAAVDGDPSTSTG